MGDLGIIFLQGNYFIPWYQLLHQHIVGSFPFLFSGPPCRTGISVWGNFSWENYTKITNFGSVVCSQGHILWYNVKTLKCFFFTQGVEEGGGGIAPHYFRVFFMERWSCTPIPKCKVWHNFFQVGKNASVKKEISFMEVWSACKCDILHCASKETYHFFRVSPTKIQSINMNNNYMDTD